jgi:hypothetical protein
MQIITITPNAELDFIRPSRNGGRAAIGKAVGVVQSSSDREVVGVEEFGTTPIVLWIV